MSRAPHPGYLTGRVGPACCHRFTERSPVGYPRVRDSWACSGRRRETRATHDQGEAFALADRIGVLERGRLVQVGTPEEVYARPATEFVAHFTGIAGALLAVVSSLPGRDAVAVAVAASDVTATAIRSFAVGQPVQVLVRSAAVTLVASDTGSVHSVGVIDDVAFRGHGYEHALTLSDGTRLVGIHDASRWPRQHTVGVRLTDVGCIASPIAGAALSGPAAAAVISTRAAAL